MTSKIRTSNSGSSANLLALAALTSPHLLPDTYQVVIYPFSRPMPSMADRFFGNY